MRSLTQCLGMTAVVLALLSGTSLVLAADADIKEKPAAPQGPPPANVTLQEVAPEDVVVSYEYVGQVAGSREVEVRSRITGIIEQRLFEEGARVVEGDPLYVLESDTYQVAYDQAEATLRQAEAGVLSAEANRVNALAGVRSAEVERESALAGVNSAEAERGSAIAGVQGAVASRSNALAGVQSVETGRQNIAAERANAKAAIANAAAARQSSEAAARSAEAQLRQAQQEYNRVTPLVNKRLLSRSELDRVQAALSVAQAAVAANQAGIRQAIAAYQQAQAGLQKINASARQVEANITQAKSVIQQTDATALQAQSVIKKAEAGVQQAQSAVNRVEASVVKAQSVVKQADAAIVQAKATVVQAQANLKAAKINLGYTTVKSPVTGVAGRAQKVVGSLVEAGSNSLLTTVAQIDPVYVNFGIPESEYLTVRDELAKEILVLPEQGFEVKLFSSDGKQLDALGRVGFQDYKVDSRTGNFAMRATIPNTTGFLAPGQFVRVQLSGATRPDTITVPQRAVLDRPQGKFVYVAGQGEGGAMIAEARPVEVGQWSVGTGGEKNWVVNSGLQAGDQVVVNGMARIFFAGMPLKVETQEDAKSEDAAKTDDSQPAAESAKE